MKNLATRSVEELGRLNIAVNLAGPWTRPDREARGWFVHRGYSFLGQLP